MFLQFFVQIFALYNFFCKNLRKKRRKFSMDPICCTYHTQHIGGVSTILILNILHLGIERVHTHTLRGVYLPYSYTWTRHTFPPRYGRAISYHRIHAQTKFRQTPPARGFSGSHIVRGFLRVSLDHFFEEGSSVWPHLALASFHAA